MSQLSIALYRIYKKQKFKSTRNKLQSNQSFAYKIITIRVNTVFSLKEAGPPTQLKVTLSIQSTVNTIFVLKVGKNNGLYTM